MCWVTVCGLGFFVDVVNREDLKQTEIGRSMQMIIDQNFFKILFNFPNVFSERIISAEKGKPHCTAGKSEQECR